MSNVVNLGKEKTHPECGELYEDIMQVIESDKYDKQISLAAVIGVLEIIKLTLLKE